MSTNGHDYSYRNRDYLAVDRLSATLNAKEAAGCLLGEDWKIVLPVTKSRLVKYYSQDLYRFIADAFGLCLRVRFTDNYLQDIQNPHHKIILVSEADGSGVCLDSQMAGAFRITVAEDHIMVVGKTERGTAQGVYYMEDHMRLRGEAALKAENEEHAPLFSPRMTHSGFELDTFSDQFLAACAHAGMDAIIVYAGHPDMHLHGFLDPDGLWPDSPRGYCDYNNLVWRAEGYGLDVYIYSHIVCDMHPEEPGAWDYYEASFGAIFKKCPKIKGIIFVGETFEFPSKDPHTAGIRYQLKPKDDPRRTPGWYPCVDYPQLVTMVKNVIQQYNPEADLVFWSYNWGWAPKDARLALIEALPKDISLLVTFEMWEYLKDDLGKSYRIADYSISFPGPAQVFVDEAEKAKECGIRLYSQANTGGRTWDMGSAPYLPVPQQWQKRYAALRESKEKYNLSGLMENHHYGWMPSFLDLFAKNAYTSNSVPDDAMLEAIAKRDFGEAYAQALEAWEQFSQGLSKVVACNIDQYGPYRCGPSYPLTFTQTKKELDMPYVAWAWHKQGGIWEPIYGDDVFSDVDNSLMRLQHGEAVAEHFEKGVAILDSIAKRMDYASGSEQSYQIAVARYIACAYNTAKHVMIWNIAKRLLFALRENRQNIQAEELLKAIQVTAYTEEALAERMHAVAQAEKENVMVALSCWQEDSRIGYEPTLEYVFNDDFAQWKIAETDTSLKLLDAFLKEKTM